MRKRMRVSVGIAALGIFFLMGVARAQDVQKVLKEIEDTYKEVTSFQASLSIEKWREGEKSKGEGKIWSKEGKFRMEVEMITPAIGETEQIEEKETIVFDGKVFWLYSDTKNELMTIDSSRLSELPFPDSAKEQLKQTIQDLEEGPSSLFSPKFSLEKEIKVSEKEWRGENFYVLEGEQTETWVKKEDYLVYRVISYDKLGDIISSVELTEIKINEDISDELFTFVVPPGIEPVDMVEMIKAMYEAFKQKE